MHFEFLVEDGSGRRLLDVIVPKILGPRMDPHTWRMIDYKGVGKLPAGLRGNSDPKRRILLDRLPSILRGYGRTGGIDCVVVVIDTDRRDCKAFLHELNEILAQITPTPPVLFRLAIEEVEAWYLGDRTALLAAYPKARRHVLDKYVQDAVCDTWELLADAIHQGGAADVKKVGFPYSGELKHAWAERIGPLMDPQGNVSPSFQKFRQALVRLTAPAAAGSPKGGGS